MLSKVNTHLIIFYHDFYFVSYSIVLEAFISFSLIVLYNNNQLILKIKQ